ncbi:MAG: hypothetical protein ABFS19_00205 [Thermodesulfobacteriota bacterium]
MADKNKAKKTAETQPKEGNAAQDPGGAGTMMREGNIDNIREILFGAQSQQYEQRFNHVEGLLKKELANVRDETRQAVESLENFVKKEFSLLSDELRSEKNARTENYDEISESLKTTNKNLEKKITSLDEKNIKAQREVQEQILKQSKDLMDEIRRKHEDISTALEDSIRELTDKKTDRIALANLLTEMSMRLKEEFSG